MRSARSRLLLGELASARGRWLLLGAAIAAALTCVGAVMGARPLFGRSLEAAAHGRRAPEASLIVPSGVDQTLLAEVRARPGVRDAERRQTAQVRVRRGAAEAWQPLVLFGYAEGPPRLDAFAVAQGAWPPRRGEIFVERSSPAAVPALGGARVELIAPGGAAQPIAIAGTVHDAGVAPSWQEHRGYAYTGVETLAALGVPVGAGASARLEELVVTFAPSPGSRQEAEAAALALARWLDEQGHPVREVRVPPLGQHPHGGLLFAVQILLLLFSGLLLILVCVVLATLLAAQLGRKTRELGVLKAIGATHGQLVALYASLVVGLGLAAFAVAAPLARWGSRALAARVLAMMNLDLVAEAQPSGIRTLAILAVAVPLAVTLRPIWKAAGRPVREALAQHGASADFVSPRLARLPVALRNALRRPARLAYALGLLALAGALVLAAANVLRGLGQVAEKVDRTRRFDVEIRLHQPVAAARLGELAALPGVTKVEAWAAAPSGLPPGALAAMGPRSSSGSPHSSGWLHSPHSRHSPGSLASSGSSRSSGSSASPAQEGQPAIALSRTYRDGGHGLQQLMAPPPGTTALAPPILAGRWLRDGEDDAVVLSASHPLAQVAAVGERVELVVAGRRAGWRLVGVVEEIAGASAFVTPDAFRRATGEEGVSLLRISTAARPSDAEVLAMEASLVASGIPVAYAMPTPELRAIIDDHVALVTRSIVILSSLLALVGFFALGAMTAIGVAERAREIGVLKSLGASSGKLAALFLGEALVIAAGSALLAFALSVPLTELVRRHVALGSLSPQFAVSPLAVLAWLAAALAGSALAAWIPARRAARLTVRQALAES